MNRKSSINSLKPFSVKNQENEQVLTFFFVLFKTYFLLNKDKDRIKERIKSSLLFAQSVSFSSNIYKVREKGTVECSSSHQMIFDIFESKRNIVTRLQYQTGMSSLLHNRITVDRISTMNKKKLDSTCKIAGKQCTIISF
jgi:hypothetical protein